MSLGAGEGRGENQAIKRDKIDRMIVNHCVFGRLLVSCDIIDLSGLYSTLNMNADFVKYLKRCMKL